MPGKIEFIRSEQNNILFGSTGIRPYYRTHFLISFRYRVRQGTEPRRKAADKPETAERNETMGMVFEMTEQDVLMDLVAMGEWDLPEITADYDYDWGE